MRKLLTLTTALLIAALATAAAPVQAKPPHYKGHYKAKKHHHHHHRGRHVHHVVVFRGGGPPPWAPAHGYRYKRARAGVYVAPYGIATGVCQRDALAVAFGAAGGGLLAAELADGDARAIVGGVLLGALFGSALSDGFGRADRGCVGYAIEHAPSGQPVVWRDPNHGARYRFTPERSYQTEEGRYCREYTTVVVIGGREQSAYGTACRQPDGSWEPI